MERGAKGTRLGYVPYAFDGVDVRLRGAEGWGPSEAPRISSAVHVLVRHRKGESRACIVPRGRRGMRTGLGFTSRVRRIDIGVLEVPTSSLGTRHTSHIVERIARGRSSIPSRKENGSDSNRTTMKICLRETKSALFEAITSYAYVGIWISFSAGVILFNKWLLAYKGFAFPIALTMFHMAFCTFLASLVINVFRWVDAVDTITKEVYMKKIVPIGALYAASLWFCNSAYVYLSVSFIQMLKALMPVIVYTIGVFAKLERFDFNKMTNMIVISAGVGIASYGELNFNILGVSIQLLGLVAEAARLVLVQILLTSKGLKLNPITSIYYISPCSFVFLLFPFSLVELNPLLQALKEGSLSVNSVLLLQNGTVAFGLNIAVFLLIGKTSALTLNIAGVLKDWLLIGLSSWLFGASVTPLNLEGYTIAFAAVCYYNYSKLQQLKIGVKGGDNQDLEKGFVSSKGMLMGNRATSGLLPKERSMENREKSGI